MAFDYILDLFGKKRRNNFCKTKYSAVEERAKNAISNYVNHLLSNEKMAMEMQEIRKDFYALLRADGEPTIDKDTPLWLNSFLGYKFDKWYKFQLLKKHFADHPEELVGETKDQYEEICNMGYDEQFMATCEYILASI